MGIVAKAWGALDPFTANMKARQTETEVQAVISAL
jgi:hypothetical protein